MPELVNGERPGDQAVLTEDLLGRFAGRVTRYDSGSACFTEDFAELQRAGYLEIAVPEEHGGRGFRLPEVAREQHRLAYWAPAAALAVNMHICWTGAAADLYRSGDESLRWLLNEAAAGEVFAESNDAPADDLMLPRSGTRAEPAGGGYRVYGRRCSPTVAGVDTDERAGRRRLRSCSHERLDAVYTRHMPHPPPARSAPANVRLRSARFDRGNCGPSDRRGSSSWVRDCGRVTAADGRSMGVAQWGDPGGTPVLSLHGTPGSRLRRPPNEEAVRQAGINLVTYDRPGYGVSDRAAGRRVVDCVGDVEAIVDALGISRLAVTGHSGGGPHALAVAARLPDRVAQAECVVGVAPTADPAKVFSDDWQLADNDRQLLARPDVQLVLVEMMGEAFRPGVWGWVDDDLAFLRARGAST